MTDPQKIAAIEALLTDLAGLRSYLAQAGRGRRPGLTAPSEVIEAEAAALHTVAQIVGVKLDMFAGQ